MLVFATNVRETYKSTRSLKKTEISRLWRKVCGDKKKFKRTPIGQKLLRLVRLRNKIKDSQKFLKRLLYWFYFICFVIFARALIIMSTDSPIAKEGLAEGLKEPENYELTFTRNVERFFSIYMEHVVPIIYCRIFNHFIACHVLCIPENKSN